MILSSKVISNPRKNRNFCNFFVLLIIKLMTKTSLLTKIQILDQVHMNRTKVHLSQKSKGEPTPLVLRTVVKIYYSQATLIPALRTTPQKRLILVSKLRTGRPTSEHLAPLSGNSRLSTLNKPLKLLCPVQEVILRNLSCKKSLPPKK